LPERTAYFVGPQLETLANYYAHVIERVSAAGIPVLGCAPELPPLSSGIAFSFPVVPAHYTRENLSPIALAQAIAQGWRMGREDADGVFTLIMALPHLLYGVPLRMLNRRCVFVMAGIGSIFTSHRLRSRVARKIAIPLYRYLFSGANSRVIVQNHDDLEYAVGVLGADPERTWVMPGCGADTSRFPFFEAMPDNPRKVVLVPARVVREKGIHEVVHASGILRARGIDHEIWLTYGIDPGNPFSLSEREVQEITTSNDSIRFLGWQPSMPALYAAADIVCLPTYAEGLPSALLEASACGRPIVTTDVRGCREVVTDGVTGLLVAPRSAGALADALGRLIEDAGLREWLRENAYRQFLERFTKEKSAAAMLPALRSLDLEIG
jgi:glycosyltransferase involved in cell wall biosynthesis